MDSRKRKISGFFSIIIPGILIAATGVGAGDLATASFTGSQLGVAVLWAVLAGGLMKLLLTEGLARWQLVTGYTFIEGVAKHFGKTIGWLFLPYLFLWSFFVGSALMSACGATLYAIFPIFHTAETGKIIFGIIASITGLVLVRIGGFKLFEKIMGVCIALMFITVIITASMLWPGFSSVLSGLFIPSIPHAQGAGVTWTIALIGGIGGTVTMLCYGYWIQEKDRKSPEMIKISRIDLMSGYTMTVIFGLAMVIIGSTIKVEGKGAGLLVTLSDSLVQPLGPAGKWLFLSGAFGAVFSSLLGVWQAIPFLFADLWKLFIVGKEQNSSTELTRSKEYRFYMLALAIIPMLGLFMGFKEIQKLYAVAGSLFIPMLALALLLLNRKKYLQKYANRPVTVFMLLATLLFFVIMAWMKWVA
jgi:Mn2+/Fe2+ NRAMP family transporter